MSTNIFRKYIDIINEAQDNTQPMNEGLSKKAIKLIQDYRALYPTIAYDSDGEMTMEPEEAHDETCDQLGVDPEVMDRYFELEDDTVAEGKINEESELATLAKQHGLEHRKGTYGSELTHPTKGSINVDRYGEWHHEPPGFEYGGKYKSLAHGRYEELADYLKKLSEATGKKNKFVFFAVENDGVVVKINQQLVGSAYTAKELLQLLKDNNITSSDDIYTSSDVDFNIRASKMIEKALAAL